MARLSYVGATPDGSNKSGEAELAADLADRRHSNRKIECDIAILRRLIELGGIDTVEKALS